MNGNNPQDETLAQAEDAQSQRHRSGPERTPNATRPLLQALIAENASLKDKVLRTLAEMENLRRRTDKEVADAKLYGVTSFARDMLTFADNLQRALDKRPSRGARRGRQRR